MDTSSRKGQPCRAAWASQTGLGAEGNFNDTFDHTHSICLSAYTWSFQPFLSGAEHSRLHQYAFRFNLGYLGRFADGAVSG